jgi:hypothetical protein
MGKAARGALSPDSLAVVHTLEAEVQRAVGNRSTGGPGLHTTVGAGGVQCCTGKGQGVGSASLQPCQQPPCAARGRVRVEAGALSPNGCPMSKSVLHSLGRPHSCRVTTGYRVGRRAKAVRAAIRAPRLRPQRHPHCSSRRHAALCMSTHHTQRAICSLITLSDHLRRRMRPPGPHSTRAPFQDITNTAATTAPMAPTAPLPQPWWLSKPPAAKPKPPAAEPKPPAAPRGPKPPAAPRGPKPPAAPRGPKRSKTEAPPDQHT